MKIQGRRTIPFDKVKEYCDLADKIGDGLLFHHTYINSNNEKCTHLSPFNTQPIDPPFILLMKEEAKAMKKEKEKNDV